MRLGAFHFRLGPSLAALIGLSILLSLGTWQVQRLQWKQGLIAKIESRMDAPPVAIQTAMEDMNLGEDMGFAPVTAKGKFDPEKEVYVFGMLDGQGGYFVFTPMKLQGAAGDWVYINRGFAAGMEPPTDIALAPLPTEVTGVLRLWQGRPKLASMFTPDPDKEDRIWYERDIAAFNQLNNTKTPLVWIDADAIEGSSLRPAKTHLNLTNRHLEYALTWYGLALTLMVVFLAFSRKRD
jgi:surfeit locus 1 family protein